MFQMRYKRIYVYVFVYMYVTAGASKGTPRRHKIRHEYPRGGEWEVRGGTQVS